MNIMINYKNFLIIFFYSISSLIMSFYILGADNFSFVSDDWLAARDATSDLVSWKFFSNDVWRFPLGSNPNYGMDISSGIAFSGSVPIMAIFFKLFINILPDNFHYFSLWIFICFFLQSYIAFLIIYNKTENILFSIIGSLFFLLSPILINRLTFHLSLSAHWIILMGFYLETKKDIFNKDIYWAALISLSSLVHFYFTIILLGIFFLFTFNNLNKDLNFRVFYKKIFLVLGSLIFTMFLIGYFHVPFTDALGYGYGNYTLDLAGILGGNTSVSNGEISWSYFFSNTPTLDYEGFAYLGLGGIFLLIFLAIIFSINFKDFIKDKNKIPFFVIILIFSILAITNKIYLFDSLVLSFEIPKILYGIMSIVRASGRLFWPVYYLIFLISIIYLYKKFSKRNSIYILILLFSLQLIDIYPGLKRHFNSSAFISEKKIIDYSFWNDLTKNNSVLRTTYINNESKFLTSLRNVLLLKNIKSTDISTHGRYNRKLASTSRANLYKSFDQKKISDNIIFAIDNYNHLRNLKYLFRNKDIGFFFRDNVWFAISGHRNQMTKFDRDQLKKYNPVILKENKKLYLDFSNENSIHGFGWTHNRPSTKRGMWTEGNISNLIFKLDQNITDSLQIKINISSIIIRKNEPISFTININDNLSKKFDLKEVSELNEGSILLNINRDIAEEDIIYIKFIIKNPVTKLELLKSADARKLGVLVESLEIINN